MTDREICVRKSAENNKKRHTSTRTTYGGVQLRHCRRDEVCLHFRLARERLDHHLLSPATAAAAAAAASRGAAHHRR
jgi:hypothetical protein